MSRIIVVGSSNTDMVIKTSRIPQPGETILGGDFFMSAGGKGANQAVAAARLGGDVIFFTKVGNDIFGEQSIANFSNAGIDTSYVMMDRAAPSGIALITVDQKGENCIVVAPGANNELKPDDLIPHKGIFDEASIILLQLEIPLNTISFVTNLASRAAKTIILNPAPACDLSDEILGRISIITPNEKEAALLTGESVHDETSARRAAGLLHDKGIRTVIITLGKQGALLFHEEQFELVKSPEVEAIDTTAAGDIFNGALAVAIAEGKPMKHAVQFACRAAAISVTRLGAQASAPMRAEVDEFLRTHGTGK